MTQWINEGLPHQKKGRARKFDPAEVTEWLVEYGHATVDDTETILNTRAECGRHFGVADRTVSVWQDDQTFPGKPGTAGKRDGYYPVAQIQLWLDARGHDHAGMTDEVSQAIKLERLRKLKLSNDEAEGLLVDLEQVRRIIVHTHGLAKRELYNLPAEILQVLPADVPEATVQEVRRKITARIDNATDILGQLIRDYSPDQDQ